MKTITKMTIGASIPVCLTGCETPPITVRPQIIQSFDDTWTGIGGSIPFPFGGGDNHLLNPPSNPPVGLQYIGTYVEAKKIVDIFIDPITNEQWMQDCDGDYHLVVQGHYDFSGGGQLNVASTNLIKYTTDATISFDEATGAASISFILPNEAANTYEAAIDMPFLVQENMTILSNGDRSVEYSGTINDVLGGLWWLGFQELTFKHNVAGIMSVNWSSSSNIVTVSSVLESRTIVLEFTNPANIPQ